MHADQAGAIVAESADRWRLMGLALGELARRARSVAAGSLRALLQPIGRQTPSRLIIAPQDLRTTDPTVAGDIYAGYFTFAGRVVQAQGRSPFDAEPPSRAWAEQLYSFGWLRHLRAADSALARANARALVDDFLAGGHDRRGLAAEPAIVARRLIAFLTQSPLLLEGADHAFYRRLMKALGRSVAQLQRALAGGARGQERLTAAIALAYAGLCLDGYSRLQRSASRTLAEELSRQILPDGGHISRNPRVLIDLLTDLLPLRQTYAARSVEPPAPLLRAIDRMMPMLRLFRHGDGSIALFNGMGGTAPDLIATLLVYDDARAQGMEHAPHSGYERLQAGHTVVIADTGRPPPAAFSGEAHAGCLSFELTAGASRIVVNCGAPRGTGQVPVATRSTAAHSTATVHDASSCHFAGAGDDLSLGSRLGRWIGAPILSGPQDVQVSRKTENGDVILVASHDGYVRRFGIVHERRWRLSANGEQLTGEDIFSLIDPTPGMTDVAIRFHLHPSVRASRLQSGQAVMLLLPDGEAWTFEAEQVPLAIEESVFFAAPDGTRRTEQIVLSIDAADTHAVRWSFQRIGRHNSMGSRRSAARTDEGTLPLENV